MIFLPLKRFITGYSFLFFHPSKKKLVKNERRKKKPNRFSTAVFFTIYRLFISKNFEVILEVNEYKCLLIF